MTNVNMSGINQDKTANRVALCSAIFAGFAYVGYAVVRQAFGGRKVKGHGFFRNENDLLGLEYDTEPRGKVYLRRLSGSTCGGGQKDFVGTLRQLDNGQEEGVEGVEGIQCVFRPLSVRERIRELNLNAMAFADTLLILHGKKPIRGPRSLHSSPFHSPTRIMSPIDLHHQFLNDDTDGDTNANFSHPPTPKLSRRNSRRDLARRSLANSVINLTEEQQEEADAQAQSLLNEKEEELTRRLEGFQSSKPRELTPYESRSLVALLHSNDQNKIARTLVTISNCAAFTRNQDLLREAGIIVRLPSLLASPDRAVQLSAVMASANLALNTGNMKEMEQVAVVLVLLADDRTRDYDEEFLSNTLLALTNMAVLPDWHHQFYPLLPHLLELWYSASNTIKFQSLRLLVNLACHDETVPHLLAARCEGDIANLVSRTNPEDQLLRSTTLLANLYMSSSRQGLTDPGHYGTLQNCMFGPQRPVVVELMKWFMENHQNYDIRVQARKIHTVLEGIHVEK